MTASNIPELSVSELSYALKRTLEDTYGRVRVRGELSRVKIHTSGHLYSDLKDADAVLNLVCWKGTVAKLPLRPEEGLEVICTGKISSYPGRSNYQLIVEQMELAGQGALLKLLDDRRQRLLAEGLFAADRKKPLPYLPSVIGVVTSPTGAVISDIMHRLDDRFPRHVLLWPVAVQGPDAARQIAAAIKGFDAIAPGGNVPRPDLIIVARGGGSLEDLMAFNEEAVVRAASSCRIPLISAVGHETDTTLIDYAADVRAPTPTGAAEMAVPVRADLLAGLEDAGVRMRGAMRRQAADLRNRLAAQAAHLRDPAHLLEMRAQKTDHLAHRMDALFRRAVDGRATRLAQAGGRLRHPRDQLHKAELRLAGQSESLKRIGQNLLRNSRQKFQHQAERLKPPARQLNDAGDRLNDVVGKLAVAGPRAIRWREIYLGDTVRLLDVLSYENVLTRGYAIVRRRNNKLMWEAGSAAEGEAVRIQWQDGSVMATLGKKI